MPAPEIIHQLVKRFEEHHAAYRSGKYNETQLRREFLDPFFEALGWDVFNKQNYAEAYKDVIHEDSLEVEGATKAPDYAFRIGGGRKFFVEAKKPAVNIEFDVHPAFQLRRYSWSAKLPLGVLSDFEEFAVYESRSKPDKKDKASTGRVAFYKFTEYVEKWDEIAAIFSREAVLKGSFDQFAEGIKGKKGTAEVDDAFLAEIERWRELLAKNIALRNPDLNVRELNYAVQMTIDRIIFLRICEDRGIEPYERLKNASEQAGVYTELTHIFQQADARYNSGLFHFKEEKNASSAADSLTLSLHVDDKVLREILGSLYYPESPYVFSEIPSDILGQVYERFLGKVIRLTAGHQAKVEEKPEVRKAGGVYYTPTYIVEYIVKNTVGKLLDDKTPKDVSRLKILDPACGSGTFPLGAYQYLLDWHLKWYTEHDLEKSLKGKNPVLFESRDGYRLTTAEKKRILLNNIYGVDIDPQAVEVTKLSLLLKVLEGESEETIGSQLSLIQERALPDLSSNIKCGNSLIGPDYYDGYQLTINFADDEERYRVNAFDWKAEFPQVFIQGGFDVVVGNPPYIRIQTLQETSPIDVDFFKKNYKAASKGNYDIYVVFVEKGLSILNEKGRLGFILPHKFFNAQYGEPLRGVIANGKHLAKVVHFGDRQVFENAITYTCLLFLDKSKHDEFEFEKVQDLNGWRFTQTSATSETSDISTIGVVNSNRINEKEWNITVGATAHLFEKLSLMPVKLGDISKIFVGTQTSADDVYVLDDCKIKGNLIEGYSKSLEKRILIEREILVPFLYGKQIRKYQPTETESFLISPYEISNDSSKLMDQIYLQSYPKAYSYLLENKDILGQREKGKFKGSNWYAFGYPKSMHLFQSPKIIVPDYNNTSSFTYDTNGNFYKTGYGVIVESGTVSPYYVLGLLNSKLLFNYLLSIGTTLQSGYVRFWTQFIKNLPIHITNFTDPADKTRHEKMVSLVERMLELHKHTPKTPQEQEMLKREIASTDRAIDSLVYELYGLTEEEIKIVEEK